MSEDFNDNKTIQVQSSETISGGSGAVGDVDYVRPTEIPEQDLKVNVNSENKLNLVCDSCNLKASYPHFRNFPKKTFGTSCQKISRMIIWNFMLKQILN